MDFSEAKDFIVERLVKDLPRDLYYHGAHHTFDVVKSVQNLSIAEKIKNYDFFLLLIAAYFHDAGYLYRYENNEELGAKMARKHLPDFDYSNEEISIIENIILATSFDVQPKTHLEKIMCDADHDYLGRNDYRKIAVSLRKELVVYDQEYSDAEWCHMQIEYLSDKHQYYTDSALSSRQVVKDQQIEHLKLKLKKLIAS